MKIEVFWKQMLQLLSLGLAFWLGTQWFALRWIFLGGQTNPVTTGINNVEDYPASISTSPVGNNKNKSPIQQYQNCFSLSEPVFEPLNSTDLMKMMVEISNNCDINFSNVSWDVTIKDENNEYLIDSDSIHVFDLHAGKVESESVMLKNPGGQFMRDIRLSSVHVR